MHRFWKCQCKLTRTCNSYFTFATLLTRSQRLAALLGQAVRIVADKSEHPMLAIFSRIVLSEYILFALFLLMDR